MVLEVGDDGGQRIWCQSAGHFEEPMIIEHIDAQLPGAILDRHAFRGDQTIVVPGERFQEVVDLVFREGFQLLLDVTAVDWFQRDPRFDVVYHFLNLASQERLRLKVRVNDEEAAAQPGAPLSSPPTGSSGRSSTCSASPSRGIPSLERLLMWQDFPGHPLRKDFPLDGGDSFCGDVGRLLRGPRENPERLRRAWNSRRPPCRQPDVRAHDRQPGPFPPGHPRHPAHHGGTGGGVSSRRPPRRSATSTGASRSWARTSPTTSSSPSRTG